MGEEGKVEGGSEGREVERGGGGGGREGGMRGIGRKEIKDN